MIDDNMVIGFLNFGPLWAPVKRPVGNRRDVNEIISLVVDYIVERSGCFEKEDGGCQTFYHAASNEVCHWMELLQASKMIKLKDKLLTFGHQQD